MAKELDVLGRRVSPQAIGLPTISQGEQLINSLQGFSRAVSQVGQAAATERASIQGRLAREAGETGNLAPSITGPTSAYNEAFRNADARILTRTGLDLLSQAAVKANDPANLNLNSLAQYESTAEGTIDGILSEARPETRGIVEESLLKAATAGRNKIEQSVQRLNNKIVNNEFRTQYNTLKEDFYSAGLEKDEEKKADIRLERALLFKDFAPLSADIAATILGLGDEFDEIEPKANLLGGFIEAQAQGRGDEYRSTFAQSNVQGMRVQDKLDLISEMSKISNTVKAAQASSQALSIEKIETEIDNPYSKDHISTQGELEDSPDYQDLTALQQQRLSHKLITANGQALRQGQKFAAAQEDIKNGKAATVDKNVINDMFLSAVQAVEAQTGEKADLATQFNIVRRFQTNAPKFDALMTDMLIGGDPVLALQAGSLFAAATIAKQSKFINLSGDAATIAEKLTTQLNMTANPTIKTVEGVLKQVLERTAPQVEERTQAATLALTQNGASYYKDMMGVEPDAFSDNGAFAVFKQTFQNAMIRDSTPEEAVRITRNSMRAWSTDPWFVDGQVNIGAPGKMLPMSEGTQNVRNQAIVAFKAIMDRYNAEITSDSGLLPMSFVEDFEIPDKVTPTDWVFRALDAQVIKGDIADFVHPGPIDVVSSGVMVNVNGVVSELKFQSGAITLATPGKGFTYGLLAQDKFGDYQQIPDPGSDDGLGYLVAEDVDVKAPSILKDDISRAKINGMDNTLLQQRINEIESDILEGTHGDRPFNKLLGQRVERSPLGKFFNNHPVIATIFAENPRLFARLKASTQANFEALFKDAATLEDIELVLDSQKETQKTRDFRKIREADKKNKKKPRDADKKDKG